MNSEIRCDAAGWTWILRVVRSRCQIVLRTCPEIQVARSFLLDEGRRRYRIA